MKESKIISVASIYRKGVSIGEGVADGSLDYINKGNAIAAPGDRRIRITTEPQRVAGGSIHSDGNGIVAIRKTNY